MPSEKTTKADQKSSDINSESLNPSGLPNGWALTNIGQILELKYGKSLPADARDNKGFPVYGSNGRVGLHSEPLIQGPAIVIGRKGSVGAIHVSDGACWPIDTTYYIDAFYGQPYGFWSRRLTVCGLTELDRATTIPGLNREDVYRIPIALPPAAEQRRIVARLQKIEKPHNAVESALADIPRLIDDARKSLLASACRGDLTSRWRRKHTPRKDGQELLNRIRTQRQRFWEDTQFRAMRRSGKSSKDDSWRARYEAPEPINDESLRVLPKTWTWASAAELVAPGADIVYGIVQPGPKLGKGVLYVRGKDIENGRILVSQLMKTSKAIAARYSRSALLPGDVLLGIIRATKVAIVPKELAGGNITQGTARFRPSSAIDSGYLARVLEAPETQSWLHAHYRGIDMPGLNLADVRRVPFPLPPIEEQREIVRRLKTAFAQLDAAASAHADAIGQLEQLEQSLLAKAFRGGLVPQNPSDEPADELLSRIYAEREAAANAPRTKRPKATLPSKPVMSTLDIINKSFGKKPFTFADLRAAASGQSYDELKQSLFALLRSVKGSDSVLTVRFNDKAEGMEFALRKP